MISALDVTSVSFVGMIAGISLAIAMILNWHVQKRQSGVLLWAVGFIAGPLGLILVGLRAYLPSCVSIGISNFLLMVFWLSLWMGIRRFVGRPADRWWVAGGLLAMHWLPILYYAVLRPDLSARIVIYCIFNSLVAALCAQELFRHVRYVEERAVYFITGGFFTIHAVYNAVRIVLTLDSVPVDDLLTAGAIHKMAFVEGIVVSVVLACCLIIASNQRLRLMLEEYQRRLEVLAATDSLSGLGNRRYFIEAAKREIDRARRYERMLALIMFDIDNFKRINDHFGHPCGDEVIKSLGKMLRTTLREQDIVSRIGGEEFAILLPETSCATAAEVAERLRARWAAGAVDCGNGTSIVCTASFGVAELNSDDTSIYDLLSRVDKIMYAAKSDGKNRVVSG